MKLQSTFPKGEPESFPSRAGRSNAMVTMYRVKDRGYYWYKLPFVENGQRKFHRFSDYEAARDKGNEMIEQLTTGSMDALTLTASDKVIYSQALDTLAPFGVKLNTAVEQFAEASRILGTVSLVEAARFYIKRNPKTLPDKTVETVVDEYIKAKEGAKRSDRHVEDLESRLGRFHEAFPGIQIHAVTESDIAAFLDGLDCAPRTRNNYRRHIVSLFKWAKKKKYLPSDWDELATIEIVEEGEGEIVIYSPEEFAAILAHATDQLVPFITIGAFAGLRSSEICRLDWRQVGVGDGGKYIEVKAANARKTGQRRLVPISDNLRAWLQPHRKADGPVWPFFPQYLYELLDPVTASAKIEWKKNALRHSFISYRVADTKDVPEVALESGNSPRMIFQNYRELVTPEEAKRWFSIKPGTDGKVIYLTPEQLATAA